MTSMTGTREYEVFGEPRGGTGSSDQPFRFTGEYQDTDVEGELYYLRARYYDPGLGRFWTRDPLASVQAYAYAANNPMRYVDPSGLCILGAPCPGPIDTALGWMGGRIADAGEAVGTSAGENWVWVSHGIQIADLAPLGMVPFYGQIPGAILDVLAASVAEIDILRSSCRGNPGLHGTNVINLTQGLAGNAFPPIATLVSANEVLLYAGTTASLTMCEKE